jgi:F-type H+-transporting ATPase subunit b
VKISTIKRLLPALVMAALLFAPIRRATSQQVASADTAAGQQSTPEAQSPEANKHEVDENDEYLHSPAVRALGAKLGMNAEQAATAFTVLNNHHQPNPQPEAPGQCANGDRRGARST